MNLFLNPLRDELLAALKETLIMVGLGSVAAVLIGGALGVGVFLLRDRSRTLDAIAQFLINIVLSFPFMIFLIALIPLTRKVIGTSIGPIAATLPLALYTSIVFARSVNEALHEIPRGTLEAAAAFGATTFQTITRVLLVESRPTLILGVTNLIVQFLSLSAIAGVVGGGGLGDFAIRYGYYRFQTEIMVGTVLLLIVLVQIIQFTGHQLYRKEKKS